MALRGWSWEAALGPVGLGDRPLLEALEAALPDEAVEATGEATGTRERRRRRLPTPLVVTRVVALGLWAAESRRHILAEVVAGWREGPASDAAGWELSSTAAIVQARQRVGARLLRERFGAVARPIATARTGGACLGGLRLMAIAGTTLDVADTRGNDRAFRRPTTGRGTGASPQIRVLALIETGTHVIGDAVIRPFRSGAVPTARHLLRSVGPGLLLRGARGFHAPELVRATLAQRAHCLGRTRQNSGLRPPEILTDGACLARSYPAPEARRRHEQGIELRVVADARDTPAGPGRGVLTELAAERLPPRRPRHTPPRRHTQDEHLPAQAFAATGLHPNAAANHRDLGPRPLALNLSVLGLEVPSGVGTCAIWPDSLIPCWPTSAS